VAPAAAATGEEEAGPLTDSQAEALGQLEEGLGLREGVIQGEAAAAMLATSIGLPLPEVPPWGGR
jgi:hypothetical protein